MNLRCLFRGHKVAFESTVDMGEVREPDQPPKPVYFLVLMRVCKRCGKVLGVYPVGIVR